MKRNLLLFLIIILAIVAGYVFFTRDEITFSKETSGYKAVPVTAPLFVEFKSLQSFDLKNTILQESERAGIEIPAFNLSEQLDSIIKNDKEIENGLRNEPFIIAFGLAGKNYPVPLFIKKAGSQNKRKAIEQLLMRVFPKKEYLYKNRNYNGQKITAITLNPNKVVLHFSFSEGLFIASSKAILVEQAIRQISTESILNNRNFTKVSKTVSSQSEISWFVNHKQFSTLLSNWVNPKSKIFVNEFGETVKQDFRKKVEVFSDFASWSELDVNLNGNKSASTESLQPTTR
ncbi:MAG: hypothetical protein J7L95_07160 [Prolixibacteraceae bacterium]|nr:hypothetical protein [Prolixibacteraceae bacterium]